MQHGATIVVVVVLVAASLIGWFVLIHEVGMMIADVLDWWRSRQKQDGRS